MLNRNLLRCYKEREIPISVFLERLEPVENLEGTERQEMQDKLAREMEMEFPLRKKEPTRQESLKCQEDNHETE